MQIVLTPEILIAAYSQGLFPMAHSAHAGYVEWVCPELRGQLSIPDLHVPKSLKKTIKKGGYEIRINTAFEDVIKACAQATQDRPDTWINDQIVKAYMDLHEKGFAHSVEYWQDEALKGGLYGIAIGGAFFGESMFSRAPNASKIALVHLAARLHHAGFKILDTQFTNDHLEQFGVYELSHKDYMGRLNTVLENECRFDFKRPNEDELIQKYLKNQSSNKS